MFKLAVAMTVALTLGVGCSASIRVQDGQGVGSESWQGGALEYESPTYLPPELEKSRQEMLNRNGAYGGQPGALQ